MDHWAGFLLAYLLGSFPSAYIVGRKSRGIDIRQHGSGNMGTMNAQRVLGWPAAVLVLAIDVAKGAAAVYLGTRLGAGPPLSLACLAVAGHICPIWLGFQGGKGLAAAMGAVIAAGQYGPVLIFAAGWAMYFILCVYGSRHHNRPDRGNRRFKRNRWQFPFMVFNFSYRFSDLANTAGAGCLMLYALIPEPNWWLFLLAAIIAVRHMLALGPSQGR